MSWKEANTEGRRKKKGGEGSVQRSEWEEYMSRRRECETWEKTSGDMDGGSERTESWGGNGVKESPSSVKQQTDKIPLPNGDETFPSLALSFPQVLRSSKVKRKGRKQCQSFTEQ